VSNLTFMYILVYYILFSNIYFSIIPLKKSESYISVSIIKAAMVLFSVSGVAPTVLTQRVQVYRNPVL
jgi:hypothetical protein